MGPRTPEDSRCIAKNIYFRCQLELISFLSSQPRNICLRDAIVAPAKLVVVPSLYVLASLYCLVFHDLQRLERIIFHLTA